MQQRQRIDEDRAQNKPASCEQPARRYLAVAVKDAFELLVEVLNRPRPQPVEQATHLDARIGLRVAPRLGRHQHPFVDRAEVLQVRVMLALVSEQEAQFGRQLREQERCFDIVGDIGRGQIGGQRNPDGGHRRHQMQFPAATQPCQPDLVQWASVSMEVWGTTPFSRSVLC
jgi:hypothetical protein